LKFYDLKGKQKTTLFGHSDAVNSVNFSPDGKTLASASFDNTMILWHLNSILSDLDLDHLMKRDCDWTRGYLVTNPNVSDRTLCNGISTQN